MTIIATFQHPFSLFKSENVNIRRGFQEEISRPCQINFLKIQKKVETFSGNAFHTFCALLRIVMCNVNAI